MTGKTLKRKRKRVGLTQAQLAERAGLAVATISMFERDQTGPTKKTQKKIEAALKGVSPKKTTKKKSTKQEVSDSDEILSEAFGDLQAKLISVIEKRLIKNSAAIFFLEKKVDALIEGLGAASTITETLNEDPEILQIVMRSHDCTGK